MTALVTQANRFGAQVSLEGSALTVAADAQINEAFTLPAGFGSLLIRSLSASLEDLSGAYVAVAPATESTWLYLSDSRAITIVDSLAHLRLRNFGTATARPKLGATVEFQTSRLMRRDEQIFIRMPIMAGAGVTVSIICRVMGTRIEVE